MIGAVGEHDGEVAQGDAGVVGGSAPAPQTLGESEPISQLDQKVGPDVATSPSPHSQDQEDASGWFLRCLLVD